ncbi:MAG TPA: hypothetical protein VN841_20160 [Bryobacteraceae bacterium]|nr:hypothetical protein [Bryobacteraceae bacterium]
MESKHTPDAPDKPDTPDAGEQLDLVTVFQSAGANAEMEALDVKALLEASGIDAVMVGDTRYPNFPCEVRAPREQAAAAEQLIVEALAAGPAAAEEAEAAGENL